MIRSICNRWTVLLLLICLVQTTDAQFVVADGELVIGSTSQAYVAHDISNEGKIILNGHLSLIGDLNNQQILLGNLGTLSLVGEQQTITSPDLAIGSLYIQGGDTKTIASNVTVGRELSLESGIVKTDQSLIMLAGSALRGGSTESYVEGFLYHEGTGQKFYPVGRNGTYAPVTLQNVTGSNPTVGLAYFTTPAFEGTEFYWQQRVLEGTYEGSTAALNFASDNPDYATYADELMVLGANEGSDTYTVLGQSSLTIQGSQFEITSEWPSASPILTVGFDITENTQNLYLPNAFSPSAINPEDQGVKVYGQKISSRNFYFGVQDTWGNVIYETTSWEEASERGWSGLSPGTDRVSPTYRYLLRGEFIGGRSFHRTGTIVQY